jgi:hypothetical protein
MLAYPLALPEAFASSIIPPLQGLRLVACSLYRPPERAFQWLLRSDHPFCVPVGPLYPPGQGSEVEYRVDALDPYVTVTILVRASYLA